MRMTQSTPAPRSTGSSRPSSAHLQAAGRRTRRGGSVGRRRLPDLADAFDDVRRGAATPPTTRSRRSSSTRTRRRGRRGRRGRRRPRRRRERRPRRRPRGRPVRAGGRRRGRATVPLERTSVTPPARRLSSLGGQLCRPRTSLIGQMISLSCGKAHQRDKGRSRLRTAPGRRSQGPTPRRERRGSRRAARRPRLASDARSCAAVRAPTSGRSDPGPVAHPRERHLERASSPSPSAAVTTASTTRSAAGVEVLARRTRRSAVTRPARVGRRAAAVLAGQHAAAQRRPGEDSPSPSAVRGRQRPRARRPRCSSEYSTWVDASGARPDQAALPASPPARSASRSSSRRRRSGPGRCDTAASSAASVSSSGASSTRCAPATGRRGRCRAGCSDASRSSSSARREVSTTRAPVAPEMPALVARTTSSRATTVPSSDAEQLARRAPSPYAAAVSTRVPPASTNAVSWSRGLVLVGVPAPGHRAEAEPRDPQARCRPSAPLLHGARGYRRGARRRSHSVEPRRRHGLSGHEAGEVATPMRLGLNLGYWGAGQRRRQPGAGPRGRPARLRRRAGRPRRTAPTPRPCWPGSPRRPSASTSARPSSRSRPARRR